MSRPSKQTIPQIQILRLVAATMVLVSHVQHEALDKPFLELSGFRPFEPLFWAGGVDIFFVISGFIMFHLGRTRFGVQGAPRAFMLRRIARVAPPYWAVTIAMLAAMMLFREHIAHGSTSLQQVVGSFLFIPAPDPYGQFYPVMILGWTLNFEMLFYAIFAVGLFFSRPVGMAWIVGALSFLGLIRFFADPRTAPFAFWANPIVIEFLFGIWLAHLRATGRRMGAMPAWSLFVLGFAIMVAAKSAGFVGEDYLLRPLWMGVPALIACAGPALIREPAQERHGPLMRALVFGGDTSYALYLTHPFSINIVALLMPRLGVSDPWAYVAIAFAAAYLGAAAAYLFFERPLTLAINNRLSRRRPAVMAQVPSSQ